jgi:aryl-alcohol dehydrogenase-like predicted oxidoreductase
MKYRTLGRTGIKVSEIGLGTWAIGGDEWGPVEDAESIRAIQRAVELGVNFIDTADVYGAGHSEELVARSLADLSRDEYVISSKAGFDIYSQPGVPGGAGQNFNPRYLEHALEQSLDRLNTDYIDVYHLHNPSLEVIERGEALETLVNARKSGKIRSIAVSVSSPEEAIASIETGVVDALQLIYNLLDRRPENEVFPLAKEHDIGIIVRTPLAHGLLTGKYDTDTEFPEGDFRRGKPDDWLETNIPKVNRLRFLSKGSDKTLPQAAIAFVLSNDVVSVAIPGAKTVDHVEENVAASKIAPLTLEELQRIDELYNRDFTG